MPAVLESSKSQRPAYSFRISARDIIRFGVQYQIGGMWQDRQVFPTLKMVIVERVNTDGATWANPGEAGLVLGLMIINARN